MKQVNRFALKKKTALKQTSVGTGPSGASSVSDQQKMGIRDIFLQRLQEHEKFQKTQHVYQQQQRRKNDSGRITSTLFNDNSNSSSSSYLSAVNNILSPTTMLRKNSIVITPNKRRNTPTLTPTKASETTPMKKSDLAKLNFFFGPEQFASNVLQPTTVSTFTGHYSLL